MKKVKGLWAGAVVLTAGIGLLGLSKASAAGPAKTTASTMVKAAAASSPSAWGLQVASVNAVPDTQSTAFQETFKLINFSASPRDASEVFAVAYFDVPQGDPNQVSFVNSSFASVFNANGTPTGVNSPVVQETAGLFTIGRNQVTGQITTSDFGFTVQAGTMVPANGGFLTFTPELWRNGVVFNTNNDWTAQQGNTAFHFDPHIDLIQNGIGNVNDVCVFSAPGVQEAVINRVTNQAESCQVLP